LTKY